MSEASELLPIGTPVVFVNEYGAVFDRDHVVSGYLKENHWLYKWGYRYTVTGGDCPWVPRKPQNLIARTDWNARKEKTAAV